MVTSREHVLIKGTVTSRNVRSVSEMAEFAAIVYRQKQTMTDEKKSPGVGSKSAYWQFTSPSERYDHVVKEAQETPFCVLDKSAKLEDTQQGNIHVAADRVLKVILPKSTYGLIPTIVSLLNGEGVPNPTLSKLFHVIPTDPKSVEGFFVLFSNFERSSFDVYHLKIQQTQVASSFITRARRFLSRSEDIEASSFITRARRFLSRSEDIDTEWKISGTCYHSSFTVMLPMLIDFMQGMEDAEEHIAKFLSEGSKNADAISTETQRMINPALPVQGPDTVNIQGLQTRH